VFAIADDGSSEGEETFDIRLSNPSGATIAGNDTAQVKIVEPIVLVPEPPEPEPDDADSGGGSGSPGWVLLAALALVAALSRTGGARRSSARGPGRWR
jgi:hypothetical protein